MPSRMHRDQTADEAVGLAGDGVTGAELQRRARMREEADRLRNERLRRLYEPPAARSDGGDAA